MAEDRGGTRGDGAAAAVLGFRLGGRAGAGALYRRSSRTRRRPPRARFRQRLRPRRHRGGARRRARASRPARSTPFALAAIALNAEANGVEIAAREGDLIGRDEGWDVVLAGDVCYERDMAAAVADWLERLAAARRRGAHRRSRPRVSGARPAGADRRIQRAGDARAGGQRDQANRGLSLPQEQSC